MAGHLNTPRAGFASSLLVLEPRDQVPDKSVSFANSGNPVQSLAFDCKITLRSDEWAFVAQNFGVFQDLTL
jgi:hypothetical protein